MADEYTREQELLRRLKDERCDKNAAELARALKMDATYINRLFYPVGKKGRKGIGLEVMRRASEVFHLPPGYWEGADQDVFAPNQVRESSPPYLNVAGTVTGDEYAQLVADLEDLPPARRSKLLDQIHQAAEEAREAAAHLRNKHKTMAARRSTDRPLAMTTATYGDGNSRQGALPLSTVDDPFTAEPDEREERLYRRIEQAPKRPL